MVDEISEETLRAMHNDMVDCSNIASSALALAANRSMDLKIPVQITLLTLKVLIEINIERDVKRKTLPKPALELCEAIGLDLEKASAIAHSELEKLIRAWIKTAKFKEITIS